MGKNKEALLGKNLEELQEVVQSTGLPKFASKQLADWIYLKSVPDIDHMTNISAKNREKLKEKYETGFTPPQKVQTSKDGTKKYLFPSSSGHFIESAYIPEKSRNTLCLSSQVGCKMGCLFCMTGKQGFQANLTAGEIVNQIRSLPEKDGLTNIVFMGMGEPLDNLDQVMKSLEILTAKWGLAMSPRRITVSTIGILPALKHFIEQSDCHLAISMHSPFDEERKTMMPLQKKYPISQIIDLLKQYDWTGQRRLSFEYILFKGINDSSKHVNGIARLLKGLKTRINLIRFHSYPGAPYEGTTEKSIEEFQYQLNNKGIITTIRRSRGEDIYAACGLLSTKTLSGSDKKQ